MALSTAEMAEIHHLSFDTPRPWSEAEIVQISGTTGAIDLRIPEGFLLGRVIADEAELLTLAVHPERRRSGAGLALTQNFLQDARALGAATAFLEVSARNAAAFELYKRLGFEQAGRRASYYGAGHDALVLRFVLTT